MVWLFRMHDCTKKRANILIPNQQSFQNNIFWKNTPKNVTAFAISMSIRIILQCTVVPLKRKCKLFKCSCRFPVALLAVHKLFNVISRI